jgi:integrase/recombinase XerC
VPAPSRRGLPKFLDAGELRALLEAAEASGPRDLALVTVMAYAGLRVSEACALRWGDINPSFPEDASLAHGYGTLLVRQGKGGKQRLLPVHARVRRALDALLRNFGILRSERARPDPADYVFPGHYGRLTSRAAEYVIEGLCAAAGIAREKAHPHTLRHTFATNLLRETGNLILVQRSLGHASVSTTQIYTHLVFDDLADAIGRLD